MCYFHFFFFIIVCEYALNMYIYKFSYEYMFADMKKHVSMWKSYFWAR